MEAHVVVATKGRPIEVAELVTWLKRQTLSPASIVVVGTAESDIRTVKDRGDDVHALVSSTPGSCVQRNHGLQYLLTRLVGADPLRPYFVAFFDDDFRPAPEWLAECRALLVNRPDVVSLTGRVLADGAFGKAVSESEALDYVEGRLPPVEHWASGDDERDLQAMYGCNMAFRDSAASRLQFDENLPLYGWQEDADYTSRARVYGRTIYHPRCRGVHLGASSGRVSGVRFGYSQIANPLYLFKKGTMPFKKAARLVSRNLASNLGRGFRRHPRIDYLGRLRGNCLAIADIAMRRCHPLRVVKIE